MSSLLHPFTSVGSLTKKIMAINPALSVHEIIWIIRQATRTQQDSGSDYASAEIIDEKNALELARATVTH